MVATHRHIQNWSTGGRQMLEGIIRVDADIAFSVDESIPVAVDFPVAGTVTIANLRSLYAISNIDVTLSTNGSKAFSILTLTGNALDDETLAMDSLIYRFQDTLTNLGGNVKIGANASDSLDNLIAAIMLGDGAGTKYAASTLRHPTVSAAVQPGDVMIAFSTAIGTAGNSHGATDFLTNGSWSTNPMAGGVNVDDSFSLKTGQPLVWVSSLGYFANPLSANVDTWNVTNLNAVVARVQIKTLEAA